MGRFLPASLFGRLVLILLIGLILAIAASAMLHLSERRAALANMGGLATAQRFAAIIGAMDPLPPDERRKMADALESPFQFVRFLDEKPDFPSTDLEDPRARAVKGLLTRFLGREMPMHVQVLDDSPPLPPLSSLPPMAPEEMERGPWEDGRGWGRGRGWRHRRHMEQMRRAMPYGVSFLAWVQFGDGVWAAFHNHLPRTVFTRPTRLLMSVGLLALALIGASFFAVRHVTRPLRALADQAHGLGRDIHRPPLVEEGPREVVHAARALNAMQARLGRYLQERTQLLAALSHDLRTPLTRMRLRVEGMEDGEDRSRLLGNLEEMEGMTVAALDYIRGMEGMEERRLVDIPALLGTLREEFLELGGEVRLDVGEAASVSIMPVSFKRLLSNLIENAISYGERAYVSASLLEGSLVVEIADDGPGIPDSEMERVMGPFVRLEESRNRETGGTGLGLAIARNIARAHGGELTLSNRDAGGLLARVSVPVAV